MERDKKTGLLIFSASDLMKFMESPFHTWMDRYKLESPESSISNLKDKDDELRSLLSEEGSDYETEVFKKIKKDSNLKTEWLKGISDKNQLSRITIDHIKNGVDVIFQARLEKDNFAGYTDILYKNEGESKLGDFYYSPWDVKLSRSIKAKYAIQLCCYAEMLEGIQGEVPELMAGLILGDGSRHEIRITDYKYYYQNLKSAFLKQQNEFNPKDIPDPAKYGNHGEWSTYAKNLLEERDHLSQVARITKNQIKVLESKGIKTMTQLAELSPEKISIPKIQSQTLERLQDQAYLQIKSKNKSKPEFKILAPLADRPRSGLALLPPQSKNDIFFDMEGYPLIDGGLEYLFGSCYYDRGDTTKVKFKTFWAHNSDEEKKSFEDFIDWVYKLWKQDPQMHVYHYGNYEKAALNKLMTRYGTREKKIDELHENNVFVDLLEVVRNGIRIGEPRYSIKNVEHLYRKKRVNDVSDAQASIVFYHHWLKIKDRNEPQAKNLLKSINDYNKDDCESTEELAVFLRKCQKKAKIEWLPTPPLTDHEKDQYYSSLTSKSEVLREEMLQKYAGIEEMETLAWIIEFQSREQRPKNWLKHQRLNMTSSELYEDSDCLANIKILKSKIENELFHFKGSFDPNQETKLKEGDECIIQGDDEYERSKLPKVTVVEINYEKGEITFNCKSQLNSTINLIPHDFVRPHPIRGAIYDVVESFHKGKPVSRALEDFIHHRPPRIKGNKKKTVIDPKKDVVEELILAISNMDHTALNIQGPPGAGKTFSSAKVILSLVAQNKRIGITSNSHKAIINLIKKILELNKSKDLKILRAQRKPDEIDKEDCITWEQENADAAKQVNDYHIICGTAWLFCRKDMIDQLDYLFIDEAGQMSLAYLVGMSRSSENLVLMGDQQQLEQPIQGVHPGKSGQSCLQYFLQGKPTIPDDLGVFLPETWRMHPDVNMVVSEMVYENKLKTAHFTKNRMVKLKPKIGKYIKKEAGVIYISIPHIGNTQTSQEEIEVIKEIVKELLGRKLTDKNGHETKVVSENDILFVAPYNLQVSNLKKALGKKYKIASVDKFQGQEAPISIVSLCTSTFEESGARRGLDFVLSTNRLNVAISRAESLCIVLGSPELALTPVKTLEQMKLVNFYCRIILNKENV